MVLGGDNIHIKLMNDDEKFPTFRFKKISYWFTRKHSIVYFSNSVF